MHSLIAYAQSFIGGIVFDKAVHYEKIEIQVQGPR